MDEQPTGMMKTPAWIYWIAAGVCLLGPLLLQQHPVMGAQAQMVGHSIGVPLTLVSLLLSLGLRGSVLFGWVRWVLAILWVVAMMGLFVPVRTWASEEQLAIDWQLTLVLTTTFVATGLGLLFAVLRFLKGADGWRRHLGPRVLYSAGLFLLVVVMGRAAFLVYASHLALLHSGLHGWVEELQRARVATFLCAAALAVALSWRYVSERGLASAGEGAPQ